MKIVIFIKTGKLVYTDPPLLTFDLLCWNIKQHLENAGLSCNYKIKYCDLFGDIDEDYKVINS